ncbi:replication protein [Lysobacteraceae bacterium NML07-0707]|nr:replication protein [Xanthomonadaceae bacterium NML07-0707]
MAMFRRLPVSDGTFHRSSAGIAPIGPNSNTGQKSNLSRPIIDAVTVVFSSDEAKAAFRKMPLTEILRYVFGTGSSIAVGGLQDKPFNFYPRSAVMVDTTGKIAGKIGVNDQGHICISMMGQGCQHVPNWRHVADVLDAVKGRITRTDIAVDDLTGETFNLQTFLDMHAAGEFVSNGRPPSSQFVDDMGSNKGCSLYIGQKGHKQLNIYEKGKQLGDPESLHTRCELRLYAKRLELPNDVLRNPGQYFKSAYPALVGFVVGEATRLLVKHRMINASWKAAERFLRTQGGTMLNLCFEALGEDATQYLIQSIVRPGRPGRFKGFVGDLSAHIREQVEVKNENHD